MLSEAKHDFWMICFRLVWSRKFTWSWCGGSIPENPRSFWSLLWKKHHIKRQQEYFFKTNFNPLCFPYRVKSHIAVRKQSPFYIPCKKWFFSSGCKYFLMLAVIFCLLKNYHPIQNMMSVVIDVYKFGQEIFIIGIFWKFLYQFLKNNSSQSCIKCIFTAWKKLYAACTNKISPGWKFSTAL